MDDEAKPLTDFDRCPIPAAHRRLAEAHLLWHQTLEKYQDPASFRANLNATIQALRNVTFALQAEKHTIPGFTEWYESWRTKLGADPVAKWSIDARNLVVKQGELEISSSARVRVLTWKDDALTDVEVPAGTSNGLILKNLPLLELLRQSKIPRGDLKHAALSIERRWSVPELEGQEILHALAHVYGLLSDLVLDAHTRLNRLECVPAKLAHPDFRSTHDRAGMLECMAIGVEQRTERIQLSSGARYTVVREAPPDSVELLQKAAKRYGIDESDRVPKWQISDPIALAEKILYSAKRLLQKDKYHARMMFIRDGHGRWHQTLLTAEDRTEKHILMRVVAAFVESVGADALIDVSEAWTLPQDAASELNNDLANIERAPSRGEALKLVVATREGILRNYTTPFSRGPFGGIRLSDTHQSDDPHEAYYLAPVFEVWARQGSRTNARGERVRRLWEPDPLDKCFCGGEQRYAECCKPHLERVRASESIVEEIRRAITSGDFTTAEQLARAALAQYVIWIKQHTAGTRHVADELHRGLIGLDIPALHVHVQLLDEALNANGHSDEFVQALRRLSDIVGVPEIAVRLRAIAARALLDKGDTGGATRELKALGNLEQVNDSMALVLATKLFTLPDEVASKLLERAIGSGYVEGERVSAKCELGRHLLSSGDRASALSWVDSAIAEAGADIENRSVLAKALALRWEITNDEQDFQAARSAMDALPRDEYWQEFASLLIDHGDYDVAESVLAAPLEKGDVAAHLLAIDLRLRTGNVAAAHELLLKIPAASVSPHLKFPYAYTSGLVAAMSGDPEVRRMAHSLLRESASANVAFANAAKQLLLALNDEARPEPSSLIERLQALVKLR